MSDPIPVPARADSRTAAWNVTIPVCTEFFPSWNQAGDTMGNTVHCIKLDREAEGLDRPPYPGELGQRIHAQVSKEAWQMWLQHQTMLINEMRLTPVDPKARQFLEREMEKFFFGEGSQRPEGYVPPEDES